MVQDFVRTLKLTNEDVIATSGLCAEYDKPVHVYLLAVSDDKTEGKFISYVCINGKWQVDYDGSQQPYVSLNSFFPDGGASIGWYHADGYSNLTRCEDQTDKAHLIQPN